MSSDPRIHFGLRTVRLLIKLGSLLFGLALIVVAIEAYQLGIDNNPAFGPKRLGMLLTGGAFTLWAFWDWIGSTLMAALTPVGYAFSQTSLMQTLQKRIRSSRQKSKRWSRLAKTARDRQNPGVIWMRRHWLSLSVGLITIFTFGVYLWIFSAGKMVISSSGTRYYAWLAEAFREGTTHLLIQPSPGLMSLSNPYDYRLRSEVNYIWDASLYQGKYYLYWGPVPGAVVLFLHWFSSNFVRDSSLTLVFVCGAFVFASLLLNAIWRRFEGEFPGWGYWGGLLALALNVPMAWLLTRPAIYEASIAGGQFFLLAGLYWSFLAVRDTRLNKVFLVLAGVSLALSAGTRINLIPAIIFLSFMIVGRVYRLTQRRLRSAFVTCLFFMLPLIMGAVLMAGYNYVRFNSIFEFGHRYQLTGPALPANYDRVTDLDYVFPNLYNYLIRLPEFKPDFSFVTIPWEKSWPFFIRLPQEYYTAEPVAGILWMVPVTGLALLVFIRYLWLLIDQSLPNRSAYFDDEDRSLLRWLNVSLAGMGSLQLALLLVFISSSLRYLADFSLIVILLAALFIAQISAYYPLQNFKCRVLAASWLLAAGLTVGLAIIVSISGYAHGFERNNPELFQFLINLFS